ncbi:hypothetical protein PCANC_14131 [Puccinia coronata f. sp. avenae]|uniref:RING-type domain-containing protein n=1 Tax=Puccinia coronata f. sp. avenae TaxID=200324 RepID=A0A2N5SVQ3_9BASI|nr:hypothetical protein PCANC_14131 [Puccinia coronata f. sp. avenae]
MRIVVMIWALPILTLFQNNLVTASEEELVKLSGKPQDIESTSASNSALLHPRPFIGDCPLESRKLNVHTKGLAGNSFPAENRESNHNHEVVIDIAEGTEVGNKGQLKNHLHSGVDGSSNSRHTDVMEPETHEEEGHEIRTDPPSDSIQQPTLAPDVVRDELIRETPRDCAICWGEFDPSHVIVWDCSHRFHDDCINGQIWWDHNTYKRETSCPLCRQPLTKNQKKPTVPTKCPQGFMGSTVSRHELLPEQSLSPFASMTAIQRHANLNRNPFLAIWNYKLWIHGMTIGETCLCMIMGMLLGILIKALSKGFA